MDTSIYFDKYLNYWESETSAILESYDEDVAEFYYLESGEKKSIGKRLVEQVQKIFQKCQSIITSLIEKISGKKKKLPPEVAAKKIKLQKQCKCDSKVFDQIAKAKSMKELDAIEKKMTAGKVVKIAAVSITAGALTTAVGKLLIKHRNAAKNAEKDACTALAVIDKQELVVSGKKKSSETPMTDDQRKIAALEKRIKNLQKTLATGHPDVQTAEISALKNQISDLQEKNSGLTKLLGEKRRLISKLVAQISAAETAAANEAAKAASAVNSSTATSSATPKAGNNNQLKRAASLMESTDLDEASLDLNGDTSAVVGNYLVYLEDVDDPNSIVTKRLDVADSETGLTDSLMESTEDILGDDFEKLFAESAEDDFLDLDSFEESADDEVGGFLEETEDDELDALIASL